MLYEAWWRGMILLVLVQVVMTSQFVVIATSHQPRDIFAWLRKYQIPLIPPCTYVWGLGRFFYVIMRYYLVIRSHQPQLNLCFFLQIAQVNLPSPRWGIFLCLRRQSRDLGVYEIFLLELIPWPFTFPGVRCIRERIFFSWRHGDDFWCRQTMVAESARWR